MRNVLHAALVAALYLWIFWTLFVLIMGFYRAKLAGRLKGPSLVMAAPWYFLGLAMDFTSNVTFASVVFLDVPRELLVTARLQRYMRGDPNWRKTLATYVCENLLDVFDPTGAHC